MRPSSGTFHPAFTNPSVAGVVGVDVLGVEVALRPARKFNYFTSSDPHHDISKQQR